MDDAATVLTHQIDDISMDHLWNLAVYVTSIAQASVRKRVPNEEDWMIARNTLWFSTTGVRLLAAMNLFLVDRDEHCDVLVRLIQRAIVTKKPYTLARVAALEISRQEAARRRDDGWMKVIAYIGEGFQAAQEEEKRKKKGFFGWLFSL